MRLDMAMRRVGDFTDLLSSFIILQRKNPQLLFIMLTIFPLRIAWPEFMSSLTIKLQQRQNDTMHFDFAELMGTLDSRASFAATRFTGRERNNQERFSVVMSLWEKNQLKLSFFESLRQPIINLMQTGGTMIGYFFGGPFVLAGELTAPDLVTFIEETNRLVNNSRNFISTWTLMYRDRRDSITIARFNAVVPTIGLGGTRSDGFKYLIPKTP